MGSTTGEEEEWEVMGQEGRESASALSSLLVAYDACITSESSSSAEDARDGFVLVLLVAAGGRAMPGRAGEPPRCKAPRGGRGDATACDVFAGEQFLQGRVRYRKFWPIKCRSMCRVAGTRYDRYIVCARHLFCGDVCVNVVGGRRGVWVKTGDSVRAVQSSQRRSI